MKFNFENFNNFEDYQDENLDGMVYVTANKNYNKENKYEHFTEFIKLSKDIYSTLEMNLDYDKSTVTPFNVAMNNMFLKPLNNGNELLVVLPKANKEEKFIWNNNLYKYFLNGNTSGDYIALLEKGNNDHEYNAIYYKLEQKNYVKIRKLPDLHALNPNANYIIYKDLNNKFEAKTINDNLYFEITDKNDKILSIGPLKRNNSYDFPVYNGLSSMDKIFYVYFTDWELNGKFKGKYQNIEFVVEPKYTTSLFTYIYYLFWIITAIYAIYISYSCNKKLNIVSLLLALCCSPFYLIYVFLFHYKICFTNNI